MQATMEAGVATIEMVLKYGVFGVRWKQTMANV
jgi:hypothetical protein